MTLPFDNFSWVPLQICFEGTIGAGKSTIVRSLTNLGIWKAKAFYEPVLQNPYLKDFYDVVKPPGLKRKVKDAISAQLDLHNSFEGGLTRRGELTCDIAERLDKLGLFKSCIPGQMQIFLLARRFESYMAAMTCHHFGYKVALHDRSLHGDTVFAKMLHQDGHISDRDMGTYWGLWQLIKRICPYPHIYIHLDCGPDTAFERIKERARSEEGIIPLEYLERLHVEYGKFFDAIRTRCAVVDIPYDPPLSVHDAREYPSEYPAIQSEPDGSKRTVLRPEDARGLARFIERHTPQFEWHTRAVGDSSAMLEEYRDR